MLFCILLSISLISHFLAQSYSSLIFFRLNLYSVIVIIAIVIINVFINYYWHYQYHYYYHMDITFGSSMIIMIFNSNVSPSLSFECRYYHDYYHCYFHFIYYYHVYLYSHCYFHSISLLSLLLPLSLRLPINHIIFILLLTNYFY